MRSTRLPFSQLILGVVLIAFVAGCTAAGGPATAPAAASVAPQASIPPASAAPSSVPSQAPSTAPATAPSAAPTAAATPTANSGGGRYGTGGSGPTPTPVAVAHLTIKSTKTSLGTVLVGSDGLTLYIKAGDSSTHSSCTGSCATAWPPLLVKAGTKVGGSSGIHGKFATFKRSDGKTQVTYNGHPLYAWTGDYYPGDTTGQGVGGFTVAKA